MLANMLARPAVVSPGRRCPEKNGPMMRTTATVAAKYFVWNSCAASSGVKQRLAGQYMKVLAPCNVCRAQLLARCNWLSDPAYSRSRHASEAVYTICRSAADLPHAEAPLGGQKRGFMASQFREFVRDQASFLFNAIVEGHRLGIGAQARVQMSVRSCDHRKSFSGLWNRTLKPNGKPIALIPRAHCWIV